MEGTLASTETPRAFRVACEYTLEAALRRFQDDPFSGTASLGMTGFLIVVGLSNAVGPRR